MTHLSGRPADSMGCEIARAIRTSNSHKVPFVPERQVVHGEGRISGDLPGYGQERGHGLEHLLQRVGGEGLQEDEAAAPVVAGRTVDVQLVVLLAVEEGAARLVHGKVAGVSVVKEVLVVLPREGGLHLSEEKMPFFRRVRVS